MRIAYLTSRLPFPPVGGERARSYHMLRHLMKQHEVTLYAIESPLRNGSGLSFAKLTGMEQKLFRLSRPNFAINAAVGMLSRLPLQVKLYQNNLLARALAEDIGNGSIDALLVHLVRMAEYARPFCSVPRILDMTDSIHLHYTRMPRGSLRPHSIAALIERSRLARYEPEVASWFDCVLLTSPVDMDWIRQSNPESNLALVPTGVDTEQLRFHEGSYDANRIVFTFPF